MIKICNDLKISIITVSLNSEKTILKAINSLKSQNYKNIEHIIIDGNSADKTLSIIEYNAKPDSIIISEGDNGIYDAINKGIKLSTGDVIGLLHSDDVFASTDILAKIAKVFDNTSIGFCYGDLEYADGDNNSKFKRVWISEEYNSNFLNEGWMPPHPTLFMRRDVIKKIGLYNLRYRISADYDYIIRLFSDLSIVGKYINSTITKMGFGGASGNSPKKLFFKSLEDYDIVKSNKIGGLSVILKKKFKKISQIKLNTSLRN
ncbi:glycosyltransferase [Amylibacter sp.]|nr:glycosyltransferase [Amylibacter sp.]